MANLFNLFVINSFKTNLLQDCNYSDMLRNGSCEILKPAASNSTDPKKFFILNNNFIPAIFRSRSLIHYSTDLFIFTAADTQRQPPLLFSGFLIKYLISWPRGFFDRHYSSPVLYSVALNRKSGEQRRRYLTLAGIRNPNRILMSVRFGKLKLCYIQRTERDDVDLFPVNF